MLQELVAAYVRPDGTTGLPVRELTEALQISTETLRVARFQPENLSLASLFGLAECMGMTPGEMVVTVFNQVRQQRRAGQAPPASNPRRRRSQSATPQAPVSNGSAVAPEVTAEYDPDLVQAHETPVVLPLAAALGSQSQPQAAADAWAEDNARKVAYADATFPQQTLALACVQQELSHYFPTTLSMEAWAKALDALKPDLWLETDGELPVTLEQPALVQLLQLLARSKELPRLELAIYPPDVLLMARRLASYSLWAVDLVAEMERNPAAFCPTSFGLLSRLASGHSAEEEVLRAFGEDIATLDTNGKPRSTDELPGSASVIARLFRLRWPTGGPGTFRLPPRPPLGPQAGPPGMA
ncbi:hypothetical protein [Hymenobacter amundsenii]|uniref:hypothetical protein n=1 Tax=Hymenobacter amundsenii TaxID=2006685 RepID=UPI000F81FB5C|nr:hypothetical protein [Hymenobacter amundsenii]